VAIITYPTSPENLGTVIQGSDGNYYATTRGTGTESKCPQNPSSYSCGAIYTITPAGVAGLVYDFTSDLGTNGYAPSPLVQGPDGAYYGVTQSSASGVPYFFKTNPSGGITVIHALTQAELGIGSPNGYPLILANDGNFYGVSAGIGGTQSSIYRVSPAGVASLVYSFSLYVNPNSVNVYHGLQVSGLVQGADGNLYGTTRNYEDFTSNSNQGAIFKLSLTGNLTPVAAFPEDNSLGYNPVGNMVEGPDGSFYGVTLGDSYSSATPPVATVFRLTPAGLIQTVYSFSVATNGLYLSTGLTLGSDGNLYGAAPFGGNPLACTYTAGCGTMFQVTPAGGFTLLHTFANTTDGGYPNGTQVEDTNGNIVGADGGASGTTVTSPYLFQLATQLPPPVQLSFGAGAKSLTSAPLNSSVTLTWKVLNAFSLTAQQCYASVQDSPAAAGNSWSGLQTGSVVGGVYTGSAQITTPNVKGTYVYVLSCGGVEIGTGTLNVGSPLTITTTSLPNGTVSLPYNGLALATGGVPPYTWTGSLPDGITIDPSSGYLLGTPTQFNPQYPATITVQDSSSPPNAIFSQGRRI
jgi:uncharacterized repeat protein (TIGR03803 family)